MNERIWDFYGQALVGPVGEGDEVLDPVKFAELIVRECIDKAFHNGHTDLEFLLKHFGVE